MRKRIEGIDLLRIISMLMIVMLHVLLHGGILDAVLPGTTNYGLVWLLETAAYCGVNCYALISGYVGLKSQYRYSSIIYLWIQVSGINLLCTAFFYIMEPEAVEKWGILRAVFPVLNDTYWYFTAYFALFFFIPFLNYLVQSLEQQQMKRLLLSSVILFSVLPTIANADIFRISSGYSASWLAVLYLAGAYICRYKNTTKNFKGIYVLIYLGCVLLSWCSKIGIEYVNRQNGLFLDSECFLKYTSPFILIAAVSLLLLFKDLKISSGISKLNFRIALLTFGVYLWHDNPLIREKWLSDKLIWVAGLPSIQMLGTIFMMTLLIFAMSCCIEFVRQICFDRFRVRKICKWFTCKMSIFFDKK